MVGVHKASLGTDVIAAIAQAKTDLKNKKLREYQGGELINPQAGKGGAKFFEAYVGQARPTDPMGKSGSRRLVLLVNSDMIKEMYFSEDHYRPRSWSRILDF